MLKAGSQGVVVRMATHNTHAQRFLFCGRLDACVSRPLVANHYRSHKGTLRRQNRFRLAYAGLLCSWGRVCLIHWSMTIQPPLTNHGLFSVSVLRVLAGWVRAYSPVLQSLPATAISQFD